MLIDLNSVEQFENRHQGKTQQEIESMCNSIGVSSLDELIDQTIPANIRAKNPLNLPKGLSEVLFQQKVNALAAKNKVFKSFIGCGYYDTVLPKVVQRNILENPSWYTAYTPYQAEIAQGRLEMLLTFQTVVSDLTGMEIANASLLDEATAAGEAMSMLASIKKGTKKTANTFFIADSCHPQVIDVVKGRAKGIGINIIVGDVESFDFTTSDVYGVLIQNPGTNGEVKDYTYSGTARTKHQSLCKYRSAFAYAFQKSGRNGSRYSSRHQPAFRRTYGIWRSARRIFCYKRRIQKTDSGKNHRRINRCTRRKSSENGTSNP
jgi:glycine dehydrogenase